MNTQHQYLTNSQGVPLSIVLPINEYDDLMYLATLHSQEEEVHFSEEELQSIALSHQQAKEGKRLAAKSYIKD